MNPIPDTDLTCVSDSPVATYSGFLPAVLAGQLPKEAMEIDLVRLCVAAGARLIVDRVTGIDRERRTLLFEDRPEVAFDVLSVGIGSQPQLPETGADSPSLVTIKPMRSLVDRLEEAVARCSGRPGPLRVIVAGGGAGGVEVSQCLPARLKALTSSPVELTLVNGGKNLLPDCLPGTVRRVRQIIDRRGHIVVEQRIVSAVFNNHVQLDDGTNLAADLVVWAASATSPAFSAELDLPTDERGFLLTEATLQTTSGDPIFVVGDSGTIRGIDLPKAGVYAVRQGPVLWRNIVRFIEQRPLQAYEPQSSFLKLLNMGDGGAVGEWRGISFAGRWPMKLKMFIDQRFMDKYQLLPEQMSMPEEMKCRGCGCKLDSRVLADGLQQPKSTRDDATIIRGSDTPASCGEFTGVETGALLVTTDFFAAPFEDAWLNGRITALHAVSDLHAMGAIPFAAEAIVVLPEGDSTTQKKMLADFQAGASREFRRTGAEITGGHTITGPRWEIGFTVLGRPIGSHLIRKGGAHEGDRLLLTQPLGSGVLMAAHLRGQCRHIDYDNLLNTMLSGNHRAAEIAVRCRVTAGTDVTGFGLLGHLQEMLSNNLSAQLQLDAIPLMPGTREAAVRGIASSLLPSNRSFLLGVLTQRTESLDLLLDPQTCGGLLLSVSESNVVELVEQFAAADLPQPADIGFIRVGRPGSHCVEIV